jgi:hypothetical protein
MALDVLFQNTGQQLVQSFYGAPAFSSLAAADVSEAHMYTATAFLDSMYGDNQSERFPSRAQTPMPVSKQPSSHPLQFPSKYLCPHLRVSRRWKTYISFSSLLSPRGRAQGYMLSVPYLELS